jgi:hypothetical protein
MTAFAMLHGSDTDRVVETLSSAWKLLGTTGLTIFQGSDNGLLVFVI